MSKNIKKKLKNNNQYKINYVVVHIIFNVFLFNNNNDYYYV